MGAKTTSVPMSGGGTTAVDAGMAQVVRLVLQPEWSLGRASARLRQQVRDEQVLRRMRVRVWGSVDGRPAPITERILQTIDAAIVTGAERDHDVVASARTPAVTVR